MIDFLASDMYGIIIGINAIGLAIALRKEDLCPICKKEFKYNFEEIDKKYYTMY